MNTIWLIGAGPIAVDYAKVLNDLNVNYQVIGRSDSGCKTFQEQTGHDAIPGGLEKYLGGRPPVVDIAIVAVSIENLAEICEQLINYGIRNILLEKPGVGFADEIYGLAQLVSKKKTNVLLAYNRRFYASVQKAAEIIKEDGGVKSFHFEFTEWSHQIRNLKKHKTELENWFLGNSTHVIDAAFFLGGEPAEISCYHTGGLDWHPKSSIYAGAGISKGGALFSYEANWEAPGRWNMDIMTSKRRLVFKPMEKLQVMEIGSVAINFVEDIDYSLDEEFKPGLFLQTKAFLDGTWDKFIRLDDQADRMGIFKKMSGY